jgi:hypothetical protein
LLLSDLWDALTWFTKDVPFLGKILAQDFINAIGINYPQ